MRRTTRGVLPIAVACVLAAGCTDDLVTPSNGPPGLSLASLAAFSPGELCISSPDYLVTDEAEFLAALGEAGPGATIAVDGVIGLSSEVQIVSPGVTVGCATAGSGFTVAPGADISTLLWVVAPDVTLQGLFLDGAASSLATVYSRYVGSLPDPPARLHLVGNEVVCASDMCLFLVGSPEAVVTDNAFHGYGNGGGLHMQWYNTQLPDGTPVTFRPSGSRVERNTIMQEGTSPPGQVLAGIRITRASDVVVADNVIQGAWVRGMRMTDIQNSRFTDNRVDGAQEHGLRTNGVLQDDGSWARFSGNIVEGNAFTGTGAEGILLSDACGNTLTSNRYDGAGDAVLLTPSTGGNVVTRTAGSVRDEGYLDCDGDRLGDFNVVDGKTPLDTQRRDIPSRDARACLADPDYVVHDEAELRDVLANAPPWSEIAVDGMIALESELQVTTPALTFGCATPGSGLTMSPAFQGDPWGFLWVTAPDVVVRGLRVDGSPVRDEPVFSDDLADMPLMTLRLTFVGNDVTTGGSGGLFTHGVRDVVAADNRVSGDGSSFGMHIQHQGSGARVERNELVLGETSNYPDNQISAAIRVRDGSDARILDNVVRGPWTRGINIAELWESDVVGNVVEGVLTEGIRSGVNWYEPVSVYDNRIRNNRISGAGLSAIFLQQSCRNVLLGNHMSGNGDDLGVVFDVTTGANVLTGNTVSAMDNGDFDCDGDGVADPNLITGKGKVKGGTPPGQNIGSVMSGGKRIMR